MPLSLVRRRVLCWSTHAVLSHGIQAKTADKVIDIISYKTGANELQAKSQPIEDKIAEREDSSFSENTGKLRT